MEFCREVTPPSPICGELGLVENSEVGNCEFKVLFIGTGVSTAIPNLGHILDSSGDPCVCSQAFLDPLSKNRRNNVSVAFLFKGKCVLVDVGKTMRDACLRLLHRHQIKEVHGILLTHGHADAILGLDDVRDLQKFSRCEIPGKGTGFRPHSGPLEIFLHKETMETVTNAFSYLVSSRPKFLDFEQTVLERRVALLNFNVISPDDNFEVQGLKIKSFPVLHGGDYVSLGFNIGSPGEFVYISDVKIIPEPTMQYLKSLRIKVLVIDALSDAGIFSHMGFDEAKQVVRDLKPERTFFVGMTCSVDHEKANSELDMEFGGAVQLAFDGLVLEGFQT